MSFVKNFHKQATIKAVRGGASPKEALGIASMAVFNRLNISQGTAIAESADFVASNTVQITFDPHDIQIDEAVGGGVIVHGSLLTSGRTPVFGSAPNTPTGMNGGWSWSEEALFKVAESINSNGIIGVVDQTHSKWRTQSKRDDSESVIEWAKATVKDGKVWISTKLKKGFEWVADKLKGMSIEAFVPKDGGIRNGEIVNANPIAFTFTEDGKQKRYENRIHSVTSD